MSEALFSFQTKPDDSNESFVPESQFELLSSISWKKSIRSSIRHAIKSQDRKEISRLIRSEVRDRCSASPLRKFAVSYLESLERTISLQASRDQSGEQLEVLKQLLGCLKAPKQKESQEALEVILNEFLLMQEPAAESYSLPATSQQLMIVLVLVAISEKLPAELFLDLWTSQLRFAWQILQADTPSPIPLEQTLSTLLTEAELPLLYGAAFGPVSGSARLFKVGGSNYRKELEAITDTDGTPHASVLKILPAWIDSFHRGEMIAKQMEKTFWKSHTRWTDFLEKATSLTGASGQLALADESADGWENTLRNSLLNDKKAAGSPWAKQRLQRSTQSTQGKNRNRGVADQRASFHSDWSHLGNLRNNWYPGADLLTISHHLSVCQIDFKALEIPFIQGDWSTDIRIDGVQHDMDNSWASLCWHSEEEGDYLELRNERDEVIVDRQIFLSRTDHVALLSDSIRTTCMESEIEVHWDLPIQAGWNATPAQEDRDWVLDNKRQRMRLLPLALPQDRVEKAFGDLQVQDQALKMSLSGKQSVCMPLWLDWSPVRRKSACEWHRLTITEAREAVLLHQAFGGRCRIGKHQWIFLRNLEFTGVPRAMLGMHTDAESIIAEFPQSGVAEKLVEVQYEED